jgi:hypothetical protein
MPRVWLLLALAGCSNGSERLVGEVHVHQFRGGAHPAATFLATAVEADSVERDSVVPDTSKVAASEGTCRVIVPSPCVPPCGTPLQVVDAGLVRIAGGLARLSLAFVDGIYRVEPTTSSVPMVFAGGEVVSVDGEGFSGELRAPAPLVISPSGGFDAVTWEPSAATRVDVMLAVSRTDGAWAIVRCRMRDEDGAWQLSPSLAAWLPPPPRDLTLEVERSAILRVPGPRGGVILHASWADKREGHED